MNNNKFEINLEWTNINEWRKYIESLRETYGNDIPLEKAADFEFVFNDGFGRLCKE